MLKSITKKILTLGMGSVVLLSFSLPAKYQTNFSGTWTLNEGKSELGQFGGRGIASKIVIDQKTDDVSVSRTSTGFQGETLNSTETLTADGKTSESTVFATAKKKSVMKWASDGQSFSVTFSIAMDFGGQATEFNGKENWSLGADGKTLILQNNITTPQGEISTKAVYDKQ
jgi:hypothetical protein